MTKELLELSKAISKGTADGIRIGLEYLKSTPGQYAHALQTYCRECVTCEDCKFWTNETCGINHPDLWNLDKNK